MKNYLLLSVIPFLSFFAPACGAEREPSLLAAVEKPAPKVSEQPTVIQELLSQKFYYFGEGLNREIQRIEEGKSFKALTSSEIESSLITMKAIKSEEDVKGQKRGEDDRVSVTVFIKKEHSKLEEPKRSKAFRDALLATAYFPEQLEPRPGLVTVTSSFAHFKFVHRQLADAWFYEHPLAQKYLRQVSSLCDVPAANDKFYEKLYLNLDENLDSYTRYLFYFNLPDNIKEKLNREEEPEGEEDITQKIDIEPHSKEMGDYFQELIDEDQHPKKRKRI